MKRLKWGLIGCGDIAKKRVAPALRDLPNCDFAAVSRARSELAEEFALEFGARGWYGTWQELAADDEIEAIYIASPVHLHKTQAIKSAESGKNVLCEKPMALSGKECDEMIDACRQNGVKLGVAYYRRFYPVVNRVKEIIAGGEIGKPVFAQINAFEYFNPPPSDKRHWFLEKEHAGGGPMFDFGCHRIEVLLNIFGRIASAKGFLDTLAFDREVEDTATAFFRFESGVNAVLNTLHAVHERQDTLDIFGTKGSIHVPVLNSGALYIMTSDSERQEKYPPHPNVHQPLICNFTQAVLEGRDPEVTGETGRDVALIEEDIFRDRRPD